MLANAQAALRFVGGVTLPEFQANQEKAYTVIHALEIIGEAAKNIPASVRNRNPDVPWRYVSGMRDILAHAYFGTDLDRVWRTAKEDLPTLVTALRHIIESESNSH